jgi:alpha-N-arabinofuranosidase
MLKANVILDKDYVISDVDPRLFGGFVEHLGRSVYEGIYEPDHPNADADGFRTDVLELVRALNMPVTRYPGGNFVSGYNWEDGVGPREERPNRLDLAWRTTETNDVGTNEFMDWCKKAKTDPMMAVNLGTRGLDAARNLLEYCNHPGGSYWSDLRKEHGWKDPHNVKLWCLGNEMDGPWQMGHKTATEYGRIARETANLMKMFDPSIELVAAGSSNRNMPTFASWEAEVLEHAFEQIDYLSAHQYYEKKDLDTPGFLAKSDEMGEFIDGIVATCDYIAAKRRSSKKIMICFDEWNVWTQNGADWTQIEPWQASPPQLEQVYTMEDALLIGGMLITLLNHADRVKMGCIAQTVNVIAPIMTKKAGPAWCQTIFHPFAQASNLGRGTVLQQVVQSDVYDSTERHEVPYLTSASVLDPVTGGITLFALNRSVDTPLELTADLRSFAPLQAAEWSVLQNDDLQAVNSCDNPDAVAPVALTGAKLDGNQLTATLRPASWNVLKLTPAAR